MKTPTKTLKFSLLLSLISLIITIFVPIPGLSLSIHDVLKSEGLPGGIFPENVESYTLHETGLLEVFLDQPCEAMFESLVRFDSVVRANLSYGELIGLQGLTQEELFLWLPVKDIIVENPHSGLILFDIGVAQKQLSYSLFEYPHVCNPSSPPSSYIQKAGRKKMGGGHQDQ